jgi:hypothetical protein
MKSCSSFAEYVRKLHSLYYREEQNMTITIHEQGQCRNIICEVLVNCLLIDPYTFDLYSEHSRPNVTPQTCSDTCQRCGNIPLASASRLTDKKGTLPLGYVE